MTKYFTIVLIFGACLAGYGQKFTVEKSTVTFFSEAAIENITAENTKSSSLLNEATGDIVYIIPINEFEFAKALMKEHFNEKYLESEKFPKATFQGKIKGFDSKASGEQKATASGKLTIHGVAHEVEIPGTMEVTGGKLVMKSKFIVKLADYSIAIPQVLWNKIAEQVEVTIEFTYKPQ
jgi:hypothetical protein